MKTPTERPRLDPRGALLVVAVALAAGAGTWLLNGAHMPRFSSLGIARELFAVTVLALAVYGVLVIRSLIRADMRARRR